MDEITRIAKLYYKACVNFKLFGWKGSVLFIAGCLSIGYAINVTLDNRLKINSDSFFIILQIIGFIFWHKAKTFYDKNLIKRLQEETQAETNELKKLKILYLSKLTAPIGENFNVVLKNIIELQKFILKISPFHRIILASIFQDLFTTQIQKTES